MNFNDICWHDGNIKSMNYQFPLSQKEKVKLECTANVSIDYNYTIYQDLKITLSDVIDITQTIDFIDLIDNVEVGSISSANADEKATLIDGRKYFKYKFYLHGGYISITAKKVEIIKV